VRGNSNWTIELSIDYVAFAGGFFAAAGLRKLSGQYLDRGIMGTATGKSPLNRQRIDDSPEGIQSFWRLEQVIHGLE